MDYKVRGSWVNLAFRFVWDLGRMNRVLFDLALSFFVDCVLLCFLFDAYSVLVFYSMLILAIIESFACEGLIS